MLASLRENLRRLPRGAVAIAVGAVGLALFLGVVSTIDAREAARLDRMSQENPTHYLDVVRSRHGIQAYFHALADVRHFDAWRAQAPVVLVGAWALVPPGQETAENPGLHCEAGIVIEDGQVRRFGRQPGSVPAEYRIVGKRMEAKLGDGSRLSLEVPAHLRGDGAVSVSLPGEPQPWRGYRCH
jgi:hypothetical protein